MSEIAYIDFSYARPNPTAVKAAGYHGVIGYISRTAAKCLTNWRDYVAVGLDVVFVFEDSANEARNGAAAGAADGKFAESWLRANGVPTSAVVFFAVDYQIPSADEAAVGAYGAAFDVSTNNPVGVYGDYDVIEAHVTPRVRPMQYGWQTVAWSGSMLSSKAALYQRNTHHWPNPAGSNVSDYDEDVLCLPLPGSMVPIPAPAPSPKPAPRVPLVHVVRAGENLTVIARNNGTSVANLVSWNHLTTPNKILPGQKLIVGWR